MASVLFVLLCKHGHNLYNYEACMGINNIYDPFIITTSCIAYVEFIEIVKSFYDFKQH